MGVVNVRAVLLLAALAVFSGSEVAGLGQGCNCNSDCASNEVCCGSNPLTLVCLFAGNVATTDPTKCCSGSLTGGGSPKCTGGGTQNLCVGGPGARVPSPRALSPVVSTGTADPHYTGFDGTHFEFGSNDRAKGKTFALLSMPNHLLNTAMDSAPGPARWPFWGTWMRGFGFRFADALSVELMLRPLELPLVNVSRRREEALERQVLPEQGGYGALMALRVNGQAADDLLESGVTLRFTAADGGLVTVHFPTDDSKHPGDPTDGPVLVVATPQAKVVVFAETEQVLHLDLQLSLVNNIPVDDLHGVMGQTLRWQSAREAGRELEGEQDDYVTGGLLEPDFKFSTFGKPVPATRAPGARALLSVGPVYSIVATYGDM